MKKYETFLKFIESLEEVNPSVKDLTTDLVFEKDKFHSSKSWHKRQLKDSLHQVKNVKEILPEVCTTCLDSLEVTVGANLSNNNAAKMKLHRFLGVATDLLKLSDKINALKFSNPRWEERYSELREELQYLEPDISMICGLLDKNSPFDEKFIAARTLWELFFKAQDASKAFREKITLEFSDDTKRKKIFKKYAEVLIPTTHAMKENVALNTFTKAASEARKALVESKSWCVIRVPETGRYYQRRIMTNERNAREEFALTGLLESYRVSKTLFHVPQVLLDYILHMNFINFPILGTVRFSEPLTDSVLENLTSILSEDLSLKEAVYVANNV